LQIRHTDNITGTSTSTPTTVANAATDALGLLGERVLEAGTNVVTLEAVWLFEHEQCVTRMAAKGTKIPDSLIEIET
jgi:hypothetical protein